MWTPKRIVLLALGFFVFFAGYMLYASCLGGIDGLPPLPEADGPPDGSDPVVGPSPTRGFKLEDKLRQAFGQDCPELKWPLKLEMNARNMVVAAKDFAIEDDGRLRLDMLSIAIFGKEKADDKGPEINTVRAKKAYLVFDKPLGKNDKDFGGRHITGAELIEQIEVVNNHSTPQRDDDLHLYIPNGPLFYEEAKRLIWTDDSVKIEDDQNKPPMVVRGKGMEVHLLPAEPAVAARPGPPAPRGKPKSESFSGVESFVLKADVDMHLYVAGGFLANAPGADAKGGPAPAPAPAPDPKAEKAQLIVYTPGRFEYQMHKEGDVALFDVPRADPAHPQKSGQCVKVDRVTATPDGKGQPHDQLNCQHLELHVHRKEAGPGPRDAAAPDRGLEVDTAHAVAFGEEMVILTSDAQELTALGHDFLYDARTKLTVLQGDPEKPDSEIDVDKAGNLIHARDVRIQEEQGPGGRNWRRVTAKGPGRLDLADKKTDKKPVHASWKDQLVSTKDGAQDLMILTGAANFVDDEHEQTLKAETLKVWLAAQDGAATPAGAANSQDARRPNHVEASGNVSCTSKEMTIPHAGQLVVWFRDVPAGATLPNAGPETPAKAGPPAGPAPAKNAPLTGPVAHQAGKADAPAPPDLTAPPPLLTSPTAAKGAAPQPAAQAGAGAAPTADAKPDADPARPIDLTARSVYAWVARGVDKNTLEKLQAEGDVQVRQDPAKPGEKGVNIKGEHLDMIYHPEGNFLVVQGDLAQLLMDEIYIIGPTVNIDQAANKAWVEGPGAMQMESKSDFQGEPLAKPVPLTVHWSKTMFFNGRYAEFSDGVQAEQENAHLLCQSLQVFFDHSVSLKEGNHGGPPPRVQNLVCYKNVRLEDRTLEGDRVVRYQRLISPALTMNTLEPEAGDVKDAKPGSQGNEVRAPGPGSLRLFQRGGGDPLSAPAGPGAKVEAAKPAPGAKPAVEEPMKLTYVSFGGNTGGSMYANSRTNTATFLENVRVLNMPCDNPTIEIDLDAMLDHLPEGAMYLRGDRVDVFDRGDKKKSQQEMTARGHVLVQAKDFYGRSDTMTFNEAKDQVIFEGGDGGLATLYKIKQRGGAAQKIEGKKITYIRSTGTFKIDGGEWISGENG